MTNLVFEKQSKVFLSLASRLSLERFTHGFLVIGMRYINDSMTGLVKKKLMGIFNALVVDPDLEWEFIDGSIVKAHQHSSGAACEQETAIGKSVAGNTSKIHMAVDACGLPIHFSVTGGEVHDCKEAPKLVAELPKGDYIVADRGYDSEALRLQIKDKGAVPVIPRKRIQLGK